MNPTASSGMGREVWKTLSPILKTRGEEYSINYFQKEQDLMDYVRGLTDRDAKQSLDIQDDHDIQDVHIVVLGGDGTLNLVLNSIVDMEHTKLSCIRVGSGNDFARNVGVDKNPEKALLNLLDHPEETELDYGETEYTTIKGDKKRRRFIISSGIGYDADICEEVSRSRLKKILNTFHLGKLVYVAIGVKQIFTRRNTKVKIYMDDRKPLGIRNLFFVVGMIHKMEGGGVPFCPHADPKDGMLEVCIAKGAPIPKLLLEVGMVYLKKHLMFSNISEFRCQTLRVVVDRPQWIHMDGETPYRVKEAVISCRQGLRFVK